MTKRMLPSDDVLRKLYVIEHLSCREICRRYGLSSGSSTNLGRRLKRMGIKIRKDAGENHHNWKGGKIIKGDGYYGIWQPEHPRADKQGYVYEHTLIVEKEYGRLPSESEVVHHINLDKLDNSVDNLWLCDSKSHLVCHRSIEKLIKPLLEKGVIGFNNGEYYVK